MNFNKFNSSILVFAFLFLSMSYGQSIAELQKKYSGKFSWNSKIGELTFEKSGEINFKEKGSKGFIWGFFF